jgi:hypothetical protein
VIGAIAHVRGGDGGGDRLSTEKSSPNCAIDDGADGGECVDRDAAMHDVDVAGDDDGDAERDRDCTGGGGGCIRVDRRTHRASVVDDDRISEGRMLVRVIGGRVRAMLLRNAARDCATRVRMRCRRITSGSSSC